MKRLLLALSIPVLLLAFTPTASASTASFASFGPGWGTIYDPYGENDLQNQASLINVTINGTTVPSYCADAFVPINTSTTYTPEPLSGPNASVAVAVATGHQTLGTPLPDANDEHAAVQIAVWALLQDTPLTENAVADAAIRARATFLATEVGTVVTLPDVVVPTLALTVTDDADPTKAVVTALVDSPDPAAGVVFVYNDVSQTVPVTDGKAVWVVERGAGGAVSASLTAQIPAGVLLVAADGSQPLVTAGAFPSTAVAEATIAQPTPTPTTTPPPPTTAPPAPPTPDRPIDTLPQTGGETSLWLAVGALALVGAASVTAWRLRRAR